MKIHKILRVLQKPWFTDTYTKIVKSYFKSYDFLLFKYRKEFQENKEIYDARKRRVLDAMTLRRIPDRVPVGAGGVNFFPAKYAGITCADFMFDYEKMRYANLKMNADFDFDVTFPTYMFGMGRFITATQTNLLKIPGRDLQPNSIYQYYEIERLLQEEYGDLLEQGLELFMEKVAPRMSPIFNKSLITRLAYYTRIIVETFKYAQIMMKMAIEYRAKGYYNPINAFSFPPMDLMSFAFRTVRGLSKDLLKKDIRPLVIEFCERMEKWLTPTFSLTQKLFGAPGIVVFSERGFSFSPKQFETYFWPTFKKMIISFANEGCIAALAIEGDATHVIHYLLELPKKVARQCIFACDQTDIFKANKILDGHMCIMGNIPLSTMCVGTPKDVEKYCERLFKELKPGGGFILSPALGIPDEAKAENVHAMINYAHKYGSYE